MRLHEQVAVQKQIIDEYRQSLEDLRRYCNLPKFNDDKMINKDDILLRLNEMDNNVFLHEVKLY